MPNLSTAIIILVSECSYFDYTGEVTNRVQSQSRRAFGDTVMDPAACKESLTTGIDCSYNYECEQQLNNWILRIVSGTRDGGWKQETPCAGFGL